MTGTINPHYHPQAEKRWHHERTNPDNPRNQAVIPDWPLGGNRRGDCTFTTEHKPGKGYRIGRVTTGKPKYTTYAERIAIVDGSNGRTYYLSDAAPYDFLKISRTDGIDAPRDEIGGEPAVFRNDPRYATLEALLVQVHTT